MLRYRLILADIFGVVVTVTAIAGWILLGLVLGLGITGLLDDVIIKLTEVF